MDSRKNQFSLPYAVYDSIGFQPDQATTVSLIGTSRVKSTQYVDALTQEGHIVTTNTMMRLYTGHIIINSLLGVFVEATAVVTSTRTDNLNLKELLTTTSFNNEVVVSFQLPNGSLQKFLARTEYSTLVCTCQTCVLGEVLFDLEPTLLKVFDDGDLRLNGDYIDYLLEPGYFSLA